MQKKFTWGLLAAAGLLALPLYARAQTPPRILGALSNFDCYNDTDTETEGFEIEIEGEHKEDVIHTWNGSHFGAPIIEDGGTAAAPTAIVHYHSLTASLLPGEVTHFGVSLRNSPKQGSIHYRWLPKATVAIPNPAPVVVALPTHQAQVSYVSGVPIVQDVIKNNAPDGGPSFWVLPYAHLLYGSVALEELMADNPVTQGGFPDGGGADGTLPELLGPGDDWSNDDNGTDVGEASLVYTYEIFTDVVTVVNGKTVHSPGVLTANMMDATITASGPVVPNQLTLSNASAYGSQAITATVTINGFAPAAGYVVNLKSSAASATLPATVTIPYNQSSATFTINTSPVAVSTLANITASDPLGYGYINGYLTVLPPDLTTLYLSYKLNFSGIPVSGAVYLTTPAPAGGVTVKLTSSAPAVASVPATVVVPAGQTTAPFTMQTYLAAATQTVNIGAALRAVALTQPLIVAVPPRISGVVTLEGCVSPAQAVTLDFRPAAGGAALTRSVTLSAAGAFAVADIPPGKYNLAVKGAKWLRKVVPIDSTLAAVANVSVLLLAGDGNNDNSVDSSDFTLLIGAYNSDVTIPGSGYDAKADFNCDGSVDSSDFTLLIGDFNEVGAP